MTKRAARRFACRVALLLLAAWPLARAQDDGASAPARLDRGRFTFLYFPGDGLLARTLSERAVANDSFPWLPRPAQRVVIAIAPDRRRFREWVGPSAPEWGAAIAFPQSRRIVMQGQHAGGDAGDPVDVLRHELAHLALHERLGDLPPRWFDEGYASVAAREWSRDDFLATNLALAFRGMPSLDELDARFQQGSSTAQGAYALSYRAVSDLAALDEKRGLTLFFDYWLQSKSMERALRSAFGVTEGEFEGQWQSRTRRRYGALALAGDLTVVGLVFTLLLLPLWVMRRRRDRARMSAMQAADAAAERADRESMLAELLRESNPPPTPPPES
ncbi:MAG: hypothetical protein JWO05_2306 [Gemmatimonadetes bacterium]|nr:hypothetical protein [Gemmatimonadota bacterium]